MMTHVRLDLGRVALAGDLEIPEDARGLVIFAHGSGSSRHSRRNRSVASYLRQRGLATLLFDLLTEHEAHDRTMVFDVSLLASRLVDVTRWAHAEPALLALPIAYFGASTGAAAALIAAARVPELIAAVVSRGGRPDLAAQALGNVGAPTLLLVGGADRDVLALNRAALARLTCVKDLIVIPGATHLFEEPGALEEVAAHAGAWFLRYASLQPVAGGERSRG